MKGPNKDISSEEKKYLQKEYLRAFIDYRNNYANNISKEMKVPLKDPNFYKQRVPFMLRVLTLALDCVHLLGITDVGIIIRCKSFESFINSIEQKNLPTETPLTEKDTDEVNIFLDYMIGELEKKL